MFEYTIGALSAEQIDAIQGVSDEFRRHLLARNFTALADLYAEDAVLMPPHQQAVQGRTAIREWLAAFPLVESFASDARAIEGRADLAYVRGTYTMRFRAPGGAGSIEDKGKYLEIRKKEMDGAWRIAVDIFNSDKV